MKTIHTTNQSLQYLFSIVSDSKIETVEKLRTAKSILSKAFPLVNAYELGKQPSVLKLKAIDSQLQNIHQVGKAEAQKDQIEKLSAERTEILDGEIMPLASTEIELQIEDEELAFVMNEMKEVLAETKKMNTLEEMEMFDRLFTALESASN